MCEDCILQIKNICSFKEQCLKADLVLRTHILNKKQQKKEKGVNKNTETENVHPNIELHPCQICKKGFNTKILLNQHVEKIHKIFTEQICIQDNNLDQNFNCPQCEKK